MSKYNRLYTDGMLEKYHDLNTASRMLLLRLEETFPSMYYSYTDPSYDRYHIYFADFLPKDKQGNTLILGHLKVEENDIEGTRDISFANDVQKGKWYADNVVWHIFSSLSGKSFVDLKIRQKMKRKRIAQCDVETMIRIYVDRLQSSPFEDIV